MKREELREYEDAVDKVCIRCLNTDGKVCDWCYVRKTLDFLKKEEGMKKYEVIMDFVCTATIVVEAADAGSAEDAAMRYVHTPEGFDRYISFAAPRNVLLNEPDCGDGFEIPCDACEFGGTLRDGLFEI